MAKGKVIAFISAIFILTAGIVGGVYAFFHHGRVIQENGFVSDTAAVCVGETQELQLKKALKGYKWESANPDIVEVVQGKVTARKMGSSTITASKFIYHFTIEVIVRDHEILPATCENSSVCKYCNKEMGPALGHRYTEATCTEDSKCERCGIAGTDKAFGHDCYKATCELASVCKICKQEVEPALGHMFTAPTCTEASKCLRCELPGEKEALGHDMVKATCTEPEKCSRCGHTEGEALGHEAPDKQDCAKDTICERCGEVMAQAGQHQFIEATCTKPKTCKVCQKTEGQALGHSYGEAACNQRAKCERCGKETGSYGSHLYIEVDDGSTICAYCGKKKGSYDDSAQTNTDVSDWGSRVVELINEERAKEGLDALTMDDTLNTVATVRANEIIQLFSHTRPDGSSCFTAFDEYGADYYAAGENIASGYSSPESVMNGWMNSTGHRANILESNFGKVGIGIAKTSSGRYYWVQVFTD